MVRAGEPTGADAPKGRGKDDHGQGEEDAGDLKPDDSADAAERAQKPANATSDSTAGLTCGSPGCAGLSGGDRGCLRLGRGGGSFCSCRGLLAGNAAGDAESGADDTADGVRFHLGIMVAATMQDWLFTGYWQSAVAGKPLWK